MPLYNYKVRSKTNQMISGTTEGETEKQVIDKLKSAGYTIISIQEQKTGLSLQTNIDVGQILAKITGGSGVPTKDLIISSRQLAVMTSTGISLIDSLHELTLQTENPILRKTWRSIADEVEGGHTFSSALANYPKIFSNLFVNMVKAGEAGGIIVGVLNNLATFMEVQFERTEKVKSSMTYPAIMLFAALAIVAFLLTFVIPRFSIIFQDSGAKLPALTATLIFISSLIVHNLVIVSLVVIAIIIGFLYWRRTESGIYWWDKLILKVPIMGEMLHKSIIARFCRTLGVMVESGVPILEAFDIVEAVADNVIVSQAINDVKKKVKEGSGIAKALQLHPDVFPSMVARMVATGEEGGALETVLSKVADFYDAEVNRATEALMSALEPILIIFLGLTVGTMVIALMLPVLNLANTVAK